MATLSDLKPVTLRGNQIYLEPLEEQHAPELFAIGGDESMWTYLPRGPLVSEEDALSFIRHARNQRLFGGEFPFAIRLCATDALIGSIRYQNIRPKAESVEIGLAFVHPSQWMRGAGPESEFLLARHALEDLGAGRVWFKTDTRNLQAQRALERCCITREGVLRKHMRTRDGFIRDSAIYSILPEEWPVVKQHILEVLACFG